MFVGNPPGTYDHLLDFSRAVTGCLFFVPTVSFLDDVSVEVTRAAAESIPTEPEADKAVRSPLPPRDGSLGIGSLKKGARHE
jgi:putative iron-dependent peroxidase